VVNSAYDHIGLKALAGYQKQVMATLQDNGDDNDEYDEYDIHSSPWQDLMDVDLPTVPTTPGPAPQLQPSHSDPIIVSSSLQPRPLGAPLPAAILLENCSYQETQSQLEKRVKVLSLALSKLGGKCLVCWCWGQGSRPKHQKIFACCAGQNGNSHNLSDWITLKRSIDLKGRRHKYCWSCGLPAGRQYQPVGHGDEIGKAKCAFEDFAYLAIFSIWIKPNHLAECRNSFPGIPPAMSDIHTLAQWCNQVEGQGTFWNGLEIVIWLCGKIMGLEDLQRTV
jgi:hypothetical protein